MSIVKRSALSALSAIFALTALSCNPQAERHPVTFALAAIARAPGSATVLRPRAESNDSVLVVEPPLLTSADLVRVQPATRRKWYLLGGTQSTSSIVLTLKPDAAIRLRHDLDRIAAMGDKVAILLDDQLSGILFGQLQRMLVGAELTIDAGFFSTADSESRKKDAKRLAQQIQGGIP